MGGGGGAEAKKGFTATAAWGLQPSSAPTTDPATREGGAVGEGVREGEGGRGSPAEVTCRTS